jgi:hypothetical protein
MTIGKASETIGFKDGLPRGYRGVGTVLLSGVGDEPATEPETLTQQPPTASESNNT